MDEEQHIMKMLEDKADLITEEIGKFVNIPSGQGIRLAVYSIIKEGLLSAREM